MWRTNQLYTVGRDINEGIGRKKTTFQTYNQPYRLLFITLFMNIFILPAQSAKEVHVLSYPQCLCQHPMLSFIKGFRYLVFFCIAVISYGTINSVSWQFLTHMSLLWNKVLWNKIILSQVLVLYVKLLSVKSKNMSYLNKTP